MWPRRCSAPALRPGLQVSAAPLAGIPCGLLALVGFPLSIPAYFRSRWRSLRDVERNRLVVAALLGYAGALLLFGAAARMLPG